MHRLPIRNILKYPFLNSAKRALCWIFLTFAFQWTLLAWVTFEFVIFVFLEIRSITKFVNNWTTSETLQFFKNLCVHDFEFADVAKLFRFLVFLSIFILLSHIDLIQIYNSMRASNNKYPCWYFTFYIGLSKLKVKRYIQFYNKGIMYSSKID